MLIFKHGIVIIAHSITLTITGEIICLGAHFVCDLN